MKAVSGLLSLILSYPASSQEVRTGEVGGRPVQLTVVKVEALSPTAWPQGTVELKPVPVPVPADANIYMMLQANGIAPDSEAFSLVYDLNLTVSDVNALTPGTSILLPSVSPAEKLQQLRKVGALVQIVVDPEVHRKLNLRIEELQGMAASVNQVTSDADTRTHLQTLIEWFAEIEKRFKRKTDPPLRQATLTEQLSEADLLASILGSAIQQRRNLTEIEQRQTGAIYEDIKIEIRQYGQVLADAAPKPQAFYSVTVVVKGVASSVLDSVRVYYTYNGLFRPLPAQPPIPSFGFTRLGSGTSENLLMKNYQIWAAKDGDPNHPLTNWYELHIDSTSPSSMMVELAAAEVKP
jgi:hypothetical protein